MTLIRHVRPRLARTNTPARIDALGRDEFEGYASLFHVADGAGDIVAPGAFARSLRRRPPARVRMLYQHFAHEPIGVWEEIGEDARGLYVRGRLIADVPRAADVRELIAQGALDGLSIGFRALRARRDAASGTRTLLEIDLWEISIVTFPLLSGSGVTGIGHAGVRQKSTTVIPGEPRSGEGARSDSVRAPRLQNPGSSHAVATKSPRSLRSLGRG